MCLVSAETTPEQKRSTTKKRSAYLLAPCVRSGLILGLTAQSQVFPQIQSHWGAAASRRDSTCECSWHKVLTKRLASPELAFSTSLDL